MEMMGGGGGRGGDMDMAMGGGGGGGMGMMHMTFFWGTTVEILFTGWPGDRGVGMYLLALLLVFAAAAFLELPASSNKATASAGAGVAKTVGHAVKMGVHYLVMLAVMSFNGGVLIAAVAGHGVGFLVWGSGLVYNKSKSDGHETLSSIK